VVCGLILLLSLPCHPSQTQGADFSGEVYLQLEGCGGTTDEVLLARPGAKTHTFRYVDLLNLCPDRVPNVTGCPLGIHNLTLPRESLCYIMLAL
jgi:hypothetical protein